MESFFADKHNEAIWKKINLASFAINLNFDDYHCYCRRSALYESLGLYKLSLDDAMKAISIDRTKDDGYIYQAKAFTGLKKYSEAEKCLNECLEINRHKREQILIQLENLRYLAVKQIGFSDQISILASKKFNTINEAINGAFSMDLDESSIQGNNNLVDANQQANENPSSTMLENTPLNDLYMQTNFSSNLQIRSDNAIVDESQHVNTQESKSLPQFTPCKDFVSDLENEYFASSPFTNNSSSSIDFIESLTTPQFNRKEHQRFIDNLNSSEINEQLPKKPRVIKNLMNDLINNSDNQCSPSVCSNSTFSNNVISPSAPKANVIVSNQSVIKTTQVTTQIPQFQVNLNSLNKIHLPQSIQYIVKPISGIVKPVAESIEKINYLNLTNLAEGSDQQNFNIEKFFEEQDILINNEETKKDEKLRLSLENNCNENVSLPCSVQAIYSIDSIRSKAKIKNKKKKNETTSESAYQKVSLQDKMKARCLTRRRAIGEKIIEENNVCKSRLDENNKRITDE